MGQIIMIIIFIWVVKKVAEDKKQASNESRENNEYFQQSNSYHSNTIDQWALEKNRKYFASLNEYFAQYSYLNVSKEITIKVNSNEVRNFNDLLVYKDGEFITTVEDLKSTHDYRIYSFSLIKEKLDAIVEVKNKQGYFNDQNRNGIDDTTESKSRYYIEYFENIESYFKEEEKLNILIVKLITSIKKIEYIEKNSDEDNSNNKIERLYSSYLPMLQKIINDYQDLNLGYKGDTVINDAQVKLINTLNIVNEALDHILTDLAAQDFIDLSVDMDVLESLLKQDGYVDNEFTIKLDKEE